MPTTSVYLSDDLAKRVKEAGLNVSSVTQAALEKELARLDEAVSSERRLFRLVDESDRAELAEALADHLTLLRQLPKQRLCGGVVA